MIFVCGALPAKARSAAARHRENTTPILSQYLSSENRAILLGLRVMANREQPSLSYPLPLLRTRRHHSLYMEGFCHSFFDGSEKHNHRSVPDDLYHNLLPAPPSRLENLSFFVVIERSCDPFLNRP